MNTTAAQAIAQQIMTGPLHAAPGAPGELLPLDSVGSVPGGEQALKDWARVGGQALFSGGSEPTIGTYSEQPADLGRHWYGAKRRPYIVDRPVAITSQQIGGAQWHSLADQGAEFVQVKRSSGDVEHTMFARFSSVPEAVRAAQVVSTMPVASAQQASEVGTVHAVIQTEHGGDAYVTGPLTRFNQYAFRGDDRLYSVQTPVSNAAASAKLVLDRRVAAVVGPEGTRINPGFVSDIRTSQPELVDELQHALTFVNLPRELHA